MSDTAPQVGACEAWLAEYGITDNIAGRWGIAADEIYAFMRERDAAYAALEQKMMDTSHKSALIAIKCLTLKRQRDELLAGLEMCRTEISASTASGQPVEFLTREVAQIDKAIAAVREVQP